MTQGQLAVFRLVDDLVDQSVSDTKDYSNQCTAHPYPSSFGDELILLTFTTCFLARRRSQSVLVKKFDYQWGFERNAPLLPAVAKQGGSAKRGQILQTNSPPSAAVAKQGGGVRSKPH